VQTVICMKWGTRYGPDFVNRLFTAVQRHTQRKTRLVCFTDDEAGINPNVQIEPIPEINLPEELALTPWRKLTMWKVPLENSRISMMISKKIGTPFYTNTELSRFISQKKLPIWSSGLLSGVQVSNIV